MRLKPLIVIAGPTACGKTKAAVALARLLDTEIISADSMQVYRGMDIGTAKPDQAEREGVPHHLIDVANPDQPYSAALFQQSAKTVIDALHDCGRIPIIAGGTGFYINSVVYACDFAPQDDTTYRRQLIETAQTKGAAYLHGLLQAVDPETAASVHPNNVKRVVRALAFARETGQALSAHNKAQKEKASAYKLLYAVLDWPREKLYERINERVTVMLAQGLVAEVQALLDAGYGASMSVTQGIGYKETTRYLRGEIDLNTAADEIRLATRHYAKRQLTWFKHQAEGTIVDADGVTPGKIAEQIRQKAQIMGLMD